ncbi:MAG TPA: glycosyltransferase, partial [Candidatus Sulfotelmatobacter sp.]|nr:glycosyltransferase [Candidatus Sulfotelmatobacter sp.]
MDQSVHRLRREAPEMSANPTLWSHQRAILILLGAAVAMLLVVSPISLLILLTAASTLLYLGIFVYRLGVLRQVLHRPALVSIDDREAEAIPDSELPVYSVLVPAYGEPEVVAHSIRAMESLRYPRDRLEVLLLLESDDTATIAAAEAANPGPHIQVVKVPPALPRTKPKACNYGLTLARGQLLTVYDAEDRPDPLQLRRAAAAFKRLDSSIVCLQA